MSILRRLFTKANNFRKTFNKLIKREGDSEQEKLDKVIEEYCGDPSLSKELQKLKAIEKYRKETLFNPDNRGHIILTDTAGINEDDRGLAFIREQLKDNKSNFRKATEAEISFSNIIAIGGLDFDSPRYLSALLKSVNTLFKLGQPPDIQNKVNMDRQNKAIAIYPEVSRQERYDAAVKYSLDQNYYPKYIEKRVEKYLLPKIVSDNKLIHPHIITLMSFSVGGREIMMMENALQAYIKSNWKLDELELKDFLEYFRVVSIGYAIDPGHIKTPGFGKIFIFSVDDYGVLRPERLFDQFLGRKDVRLSVYTIHKLAEEQHMIILGHDTIPNELDRKIHPLDHSLPHYVEALKVLPDDIKSLMYFLFSGNIAELGVLGDDISGKGED